MRNDARSIDIGAMEYTVGPTGASSSVTDPLSIIITFILILANPPERKPE